MENISRHRKREETLNSMGIAHNVDFGEEVVSEETALAPYQYENHQPENRILLDITNWEKGKGLTLFICLLATWRRFDKR